MLTDHRCTKYTDCSSCSFYQRDIFKYRLYPKGYVIPAHPINQGENSLIL